MPHRVAGTANMARSIWCVFLLLALISTTVSARRGGSSSGSSSSSKTSSSKSSTKPSTPSISSTISKPTAPAAVATKPSGTGGLLSSTGAKVGTGLAAGAVAGVVAGKAFRARRTTMFPHYYYYYYGSSSRYTNRQCDGKNVVCFRDYCQLGVSSCFNTTGVPASANSIMDGLNSTVLDTTLPSNTTAGSIVDITAAALAASRGMPPLQLVPCPSNVYSECYMAERDSVVYVCNGRRAADNDSPVDAACGEVVSDADLSQLQAAAQATSSAAFPLVSTGVALMSVVILSMGL